MERHITKKKQTGKTKKKKKSRSLGLEPCEKDFRIIGVFVFFGLGFLVFWVWFFWFFRFGSVVL